MCTPFCFILAIVALAAAGAAFAQESGALVSNVKVISDKVPDVSSMEAWKAAAIKPGMTDEEKALAIWRTAVTFRQQNPPPLEFLLARGMDVCVHDAIKTFNVYGYGICCCVSADIESLARYVGLEARGRSVRVHSLPELYYDGAWHMFDASMINYFRDSEGRIAGVDEVLAAAAAWYKEHPEHRDNEEALRAFMKGGGWRKGPAMLAESPFYSEDGWLPGGTAGWHTTMKEYDGSVNFVFEFGYSQGYRVNIQLKPGLVLTRNWSNRGLHLNMDQGGEAPSVLTTSVGSGELTYAPGYGDLAPGRIGNGTVVYTAPLSDGLGEIAPLSADNVISRKSASPALALDAAGKPGTMVLRMPSPYVYLGGMLSAAAVVGRGGSVSAYLSRNNGLDWQEIASATTAGRSDISVDLTPLVYRLYDYRLKFELEGAGTGLDALVISNDIQESQRALPALGPDDNTITFSAAPVDEAAITIEPALTREPQGNQLSILDFHGEIDGLEFTAYGLQGGKDGGALTVPIETPGDMTRLRFGCHTKTRRREDGWDFLVSFDGGSTWRAAGRCPGGENGMSHYVTYGDVPAGTRGALVRYACASGDANTALGSIRIDADYREPAAGFRPVRITYAWAEGASQKSDVHVARSPEETYTITCGDAPAFKPVMKSIVLELAR